MTPMIAVAAAGDPRNSRTWSGTPKALVEALERQGFDVLGFSGQTEPGWRNAAYLPQIMLHGAGARRFRHYYGPIFERNVNEYRRFRQNYADLRVIHTDYMWLDPADVGPADFLYRDTGWSQWARSRGLNARLASRIGDRYRTLLRKVGHIFVTSEWAKTQVILDGAPAQKVSVVGTGVGNLISSFDGEKDYTNGMTLCVAKVRHWDKGVDLLVGGFKIARSRRPDLSLHLVVPHGSVAEGAGIYTYSDLAPSELVELYHRSSLYAMPARNEPYGLVYLEAQLAGLALLGSSSGAFPEFAEHGRSGVIVDNLSPLSIAQTLLSMHGDAKALASMGKRGQSTARSASWDRTAGAMVREMFLGDKCSGIPKVAEQG
ncbi:glycosyltransferase family 4 protein [Sinomonas sp. B1-1]|uniref:glycosyltransferase family 4 protein n=1 Tax=Sinomonas sp. B1-1 TaxID=3141454 RepID=UPI003D2AB06C